MPDGSIVGWNWDTVAKVARLLTIDANGKNATQDDFNRDKIVQYGFTWNYELSPEYWGSYWEGGSELTSGGSTGSYNARIPAAWKAAWAWTYYGIWGRQPFIANRNVEQDANFGSGNPFSSNKFAMTIQPAWYTCCIGEVWTWDFAAVPAYFKTGGRVDADTFRILKASKHPQEAFTVLSYLVTTGVDKLIVGPKPAYGAMSALSAKQQLFVNSKKAQFPWVKNWDTLIAGLQYPDIPNAESWVPNYIEAWQRNSDFGDRLTTTSDLDLDAEIANLEVELTVIYNK